MFRGADAEGRPGGTLVSLVPLGDIKEGSRRFNGCLGNGYAWQFCADCTADRPIDHLGALESSDFALRIIDMLATLQRYCCADDSNQALQYNLLSADQVYDQCKNDGEKILHSAGRFS